MSSKFDLPRIDEYPERIDINAIRESLFAESKKYLAGVESRLSTNGVAVKTESVEAKKPANAIKDYARKNGMDLIVMSTHGYTGLKKLLLGCVAAEVLNQSHVPVLLIPTRGLTPVAPVWAPTTPPGSGKSQQP